MPPPTFTEVLQQINANAATPVQVNTTKAPTLSQRTVEFSINMNEIGGTFESKYRGRKCILIEPRHTPNFWAPMSHGYVETVDEAGIYIVEEAIRKLGHPSYVIMAILMDKPLPDGRKCMIEQQFAPSFLELIKDAPDNPVVRAHIMRLLKVEPPKELKGYDALKDWVEREFFPRMDAHLTESPMNIPAPPNATFDLEQVVVDPHPPRPTAAPNEEPSISFGINASEMESGSAYYSVRKRARVSEDISIHWICELISSGNTLDEVIQKIHEYLDAHDDLDWDYGEYNYHDHESNDNDEYQSDLAGGIEHNKERLVNFLRQQNREEIIEMAAENQD